MKKFLILSIALLTLVNIGNYAYAQEFGEESTMSRQEARRAARAAHKRAMEAEQLKEFNQAVECIKNGSFLRFCCSVLSRQSATWATPACTKR